MKFLGLKYTKISVKKNPNFDGKITMNQNIKINSIEDYKQLDRKEESIKVSYKFEVSYGDLGNIELEGILFLAMDSKLQKQILKDFESKKADTEENVLIMNLIIQKSSIKAMELEEEMNLPIHVKLPSLQFKK